MSGKKIIREKKSFHLLTLGILCIVAGQLVSCVTGTGAPAEQTAAEPVSASASIAQAVDDTGMSEVKVVDVTDYYSRPEIEDPGFGRGLATFQ